MISVKMIENLEKEFYLIILSNCLKSFKIPFFLSDFNKLFITKPKVDMNIITGTDSISRRKRIFKNILFFRITKSMQVINV